MITWPGIMRRFFPSFRLGRKPRQGLYSTNLPTGYGQQADKPNQRILSLVLFSPPRRARRLISLPYTYAAGICADDWDSHCRLLLSALDLANELGAAHVELRQAGDFQVCLEGVTGSWRHTVHHFKTGLR
ncbi:MAG: hypothetical protein QNK24_02250, partial [Desulfuromusa sp.]|nr:hypothetical protein [Desulfuromusa sp.]